MARPVPDRGRALSAQLHRLRVGDGPGHQALRARRLSQRGAAPADRQADRPPHLALLGDREPVGQPPARCRPGGAREHHVHRLLRGPDRHVPRGVGLPRLRPAKELHAPASVGKSYEYDFGALIEALDRELRKSAFGLVACEPNWIYPLCNTIGGAAMKAHDRMLRQDRWSAHEAAFRRCLEHEFIDLPGRFVPCRSSYSGFALPMIGGAQPQAMPSFFLNATMPDVALRQWLLLRRELLQDGKLRRAQFWAVDTGNYRFSRASAYAGTAMAAVELGDGEVAELCLAALQEECPAQAEGDAFYRPNASVWAHAVEFCARGGGKNAFRDLIERPRDRTPQPAI